MGIFKIQFARQFIVFFVKSPACNKYFYFFLHYFMILKV